MIARIFISTVWLFRIFMMIIVFSLAGVLSSDTVMRTRCSSHYKRHT